MDTLPTFPVTPDDLKLALERAKFVTDLVKHIATLASGSIVVLATFLSRVQGPVDKGSLVTGVALLLGCIVLCFMHMFFFGIVRTWSEEPTVATRSLTDRVLAESEHKDRIMLTTLTKPYIVVSALIFLTFLGGMFFLGISIIRTL